jgi:hypothetical protein
MQTHECVQQPVVRATFLALLLPAKHSSTLLFRGEANQQHGLRNVLDIWKGMGTSNTQGVPAGIIPCSLI